LGLGVLGQKWWQFSPEVSNTTKLGSRLVLKAKSSTAFWVIFVPGNV